MLFVFYAEIQDNHQKGGGGGGGGVGTIFEKKMADDSAHTLRAKNFAEIALSCTISEILKIFIFSINKNCGV